MIRIALLCGLLFFAVAVPAQAVTLAEAMKVLEASEFNHVWDSRDGKAKLLGKIQAGKRRFWVVTTEVPGLRNQGTQRLFCRVAVLEEKAGRLSYLGNYHPDCEEAFRVNGQRIEYRFRERDGSRNWYGFTVTEKGPPPGFYGGTDTATFAK